MLFKEETKNLPLITQSLKNRNEEYEALKKKALEQFKTGQPLLGKDGAFTPLMETVPGICTRMSNWLVADFLSPHGGIEAGLHRIKNVDPTGGWNSIGAGETVDNLYATTIAGDLGQSATMKTLGQQAAYVGENTEATDAEMIGDLMVFFWAKTSLIQTLK